MTAALIGQTIAGRFRLTGFIGEGAMATVYRGVQEAEPRDVAVKIMHAHLARDPTFSARFRREAKAAALLRHPNTVHIVDYGQDRDLLYIAMELITGQDLFEMLVLDRRFSEARATWIVAQVCDALKAAHAKGIVHRDLKPENVMVIQDARDPTVEHVKVLDFGIAKVLDRDKAPASSPDSSSDEAPSSLVASALTTVGVVVGTPAYMSPEQCRAEPVDARSDVYSCGILLYQLVCGRTPFTGDSPIEIAINQVRMPPDLPSSILPTIHPRLEQIILKALEKWPAQRQQSAAELRDELLAVLPQLTDDRKPLSSGKKQPAPEARPPEPEPAPMSEDPSDLAATMRKDTEPARVVLAHVEPAPPTLSPRMPAAIGGARREESAPLPIAPPKMTAPSIEPRLPAQPSPVISVSPPSSGPISSPIPSSEPISGPPSIEIFPRPFGPPLVERPDAPRPPMGSSPVLPPQASAAHRPATDPLPLTTRKAPAAALPSWLVLILAVLIGVGVGVAAHFIANR